MKTLLTIGIIVLGILKTTACSCDLPHTVANAFKYTQTIVHGRVIKKSFISVENAMMKEKADSLKIILQDDSQGLALLGAKLITEIHVKILKVYKGTLIGDTITVYTSRSSASCGFTRFIVGQEFLIYASSNSDVFPMFRQKIRLEKENTFWTNYCTRTKEYDFQEALELSSLGRQ